MATCPLARCDNVLYVFRMSESRITVTKEALSRRIVAWLTAMGERRPSALRDLYTRPGERADSNRRSGAHHELARFLAEEIIGSGEVTRRATESDQTWAAANEGEG